MSCQLTNYLVGHPLHSHMLRVGGCHQTLNFPTSSLNFKNIYYRAVLLCSLDLTPFMPLFISIPRIDNLELTWGMPSISWTLSDLVVQVLCFHSGVAQIPSGVGWLQQLHIQPFVKIPQICLQSLVTQRGPCVVSQFRHFLCFFQEFTLCSIIVSHQSTKVQNVVER